MCRNHNSIKSLFKVLIEKFYSFPIFEHDLRNKISETLKFNLLCNIDDSQKMSSNDLINLLIEVKNKPNPPILSTKYETAFTYKGECKNEEC